MMYRAEILNTHLSAWFHSMGEAQRWLDSMNNNYEHKTVIETYDEAGNKIDGFFYTE